MTVKGKIRLVTLASLLCASAAIWLSIHLILARVVSRLEAQAVRDETQRSAQLLQEQFAPLNTTAADWARWDDTYQFIRDRNKAYIRSNLLDETLARVGVDVVVYADTEGRIVFSKALPWRAHAPSADPRSLWSSPSFRKPLLSRCLRGNTTTGFMVLQEGTLLVSAHPILDSMGNGPPRGMLLLGRLLDSRDLNALNRGPLLSLGLWRVNDSRLPADLAAAQAELRRGPASVRVLGPDIVAGYALLRDVRGLPALVLRVTLPRSIYRQGHSSLLIFGLVLLAVAALFGLAVNVVLDRTVTSRLSAVSARLREIAGQGEASARLSLPGKDELAVLARDINSMLQALEHSQDTVRGSERQLRTIMDVMQTGYLIIDAESHVIAGANAAALGMIGAPEQSVVGSMCHCFICPAELGRCPVTDLGEEVNNSERVLLTAGGERLPILKTAVAVTLGERRYIVENFIDITERKRSEEAVRHQAYHDSLTGLPNRAYLYDRLEQALQEAARSDDSLAVLFLDLDRFKTINDTMGHAVGDALLREVAARLAQCLRGEDTIARLGGDEFALLLPLLKQPDVASLVAQRVLEALRQPFAIGGLDLHSSASIGISLFPRDGRNAEDLLKRADIALYHAKDQGRNTFRYYDAGITVATRERLSLEHDLRLAVERGEFVLHYQPQVHVPSGRVVGLEALLRWQHPEWGLVLPGRFISLAEETGLIEPIGEWVLREACAQSRAWQAEGLPPVKVAVNVSPLQFHQRNLVGVVQEALHSTGLPPGLLELELTESTAMRNVDFSVRLMASLKAMGVGLCLDDFGVGYTSLVYLKQFPLDVVKVDRTFISTLQQLSRDAAIVPAIVGIARSLGLGIIGEGVETEAQLRFLLGHGCEVMQGYLLSHPLPAAGIPTLLRQHLLTLTYPSPD